MNVGRSECPPKRRRSVRIILLLFGSMAWSGCVVAQTAMVAQAGPATAHPRRWPALSATPLLDPEREAFVSGLLGHMSLQDKVGQMIQADIAYITPDDLHRYKLGSILAGGLSAPGGNLEAAPAAWLKLVSDYKQAALAGKTPAHEPIPILFGIDAVHGNAKLRGATIFPHNIGLGAAHDPDLIRRIGVATAQEVAAVGIDWAFAPTIAVARDVRWGRTYESYSDDPGLVAAYAPAMVSGLQGEAGSSMFFAPGHVLASAKHFLGDGGTQDGRDQGDTRVSEDVLRGIHGAAYRDAVRAGVGSVMASYNSWQGVKMHANGSLLTGVLKQRWHFGGFVIGDWDAQEQVPGCTKSSCAKAFNAGIDMIMAPDGWKQMYANLLEQARSGIVPLSRINDAVRRILRVKAAAGLIGPAHPAAHGESGNFAQLGSAEHRALARRAVRESLVLLKNNGGVLPIAPGLRVLVAGEAADSIGDQCGGWTVDWQGSSGRNADTAGGTSIFGGIRAAVERGGGAAQYSPDGAFTRKPDVAIVVFGERPYAEFEGDVETLALPRSDHVLALLRRLQAQHIPVVSVLLSGRPLWVNPELNVSDGFIAAWLPGSEGEGVADLLFRGKTEKAGYDFTGRLSFPWPATAMPVAYDRSGRVAGALFARGYGLDARHPATLAALSEDARVPPRWKLRDTFLGGGHVTAPWGLYAGDRLGQTRFTGGQHSSPGQAVTGTFANGAVRVAWSGHGEGSLWIGDRVTDLSAAAASGDALTLHYRMEQTPGSNMLLGMNCGAECAGWVDVTRELGAAQGRGWQNLKVPLSCFAAHGAALQHVEVPLVLKTAGAASLTISTISLEAGRPAAACPPGNTLPQPQTR